MTFCIYLTHPNVDIDPARPVSQWNLSDKGRARLEQGLSQPWLTQVDHVVCSSEKKALETGQVLAGHLGMELTTAPNLQENNRDATGYLPKEEFEQVADEFFARPAVNIRGWERALDAQNRIVKAITSVLKDTVDNESVLFVGHGGVGTLLKCHLANTAIARAHDQPNGGGYWFSFPKTALQTLSLPLEKLAWQPIEVRQTQKA
ncbi:histidine phosphatase family protein [Polycladidibacter stylochi]|uniref:histidine phosphatase family protein n=1 Tax=Polycladidibacter stylochi TaxID=1807766 RepID=UPI0008331C4B|nr:histidine phosphatase family protein [Pseudovibrio stylochi]